MLENTSKECVYRLLRTIEKFPKEKRTLFVSLIEAMAYGMILEKGFVADSILKKPYNKNTDKQAKGEITYEN